MNKLIISITIACTLLFTGELFAQSKASNVTDRMIIKYKTQSLNQAASFRHSERVSNQQALRVVADIQTNLKSKASYVRGSAKTNLHVVKLDKMYHVAELKSLAQALKDDDANIEYAEPDLRMFPLNVSPNDTYYQYYQWSFHSTYGINMPAAWEISTGSEDVVVAVIDSGILRNHMDFSSTRLLDGYDFMSAVEGTTYYLEDLYQAADGDGRDADSSDVGDYVDATELPESMKMHCSESFSTWHGTHVAGTIGAEANDGFGVAGIDWKAKILPIRVLGKCGGYMLDIAEAIVWAAGGDVQNVPKNLHPANVINLSLGGEYESCPNTYQLAINKAKELGAFVVAAAGNDNKNVSTASPANCDNVFTVGASQKTGRRSAFSNYGTNVDILAPGGTGGQFGSCDTDIPSTADGGETLPLEDSQHLCLAGTSMAAPHVSGVASLMLAANPNLTPTQIAATLKASARSHVDSSCHILGCGVGLLDANEALIGVMVPVAVSELTSLNRSNYVELNWSDNSEYEKEFEILRSKKSATFEVIASVGKNISTYRDLNVSAGDYDYKVIAKNGDWKSSNNPTTSINVSLFAPHNLSISMKKNIGNTLTWLDANNAVAEYVLERSVNDGEFVEVARSSMKAFQDPEIADGKRYAYRVKAIFGEISSEYTEVTVLWVPLNTPTISYAQKIGSGVLLKWNDHSISETQYQIERSTDAEAFYLIGSVDENVTEFIDKNLSASTKYYYRVRAINAEMDSNYTSTLVYTAPSDSSAGGALQLLWLLMFGIVLIQSNTRR